MRLFIYGFIIAVLGAVFFLVLVPRVDVVAPAVVLQNGDGQVAVASLPSVPEASRPTSTPPQPKFSPLLTDLPNQPQLPSPPEVVKGIYLTGWSAGYAPRINSLIALISRTELNAMVIDIKDFSGHVSYKTGLPEVAATGAENELRVLQPNALLKKLHDANIYVIGRVTVFQDPLLAKAHPEWALKNASTSKIWTDNKGLAWMDPAAKPVWEYNLSIAKDALTRGFDEIQFDYIRFVSDGDLGQISYPFWDKKTARHKIVGQFFKFLRDSLPGAKISADLFGLSTIDTWDDLGIGQVIEDAYKNFDYVSPMVYPSHYATGFLGYKNPAAHPYEVVRYSMEKALERLKAAVNTLQMATSTQQATTTASSSQPITNYQLPITKLRPWLQDFDLGAIYDAAMVKKQIQATYDVSGCPEPEIASQSRFRASPEPEIASQSRFGASPEPCSALVQGWLLWDPTNTYTEGALEKE